MQYSFFEGLEPLAKFSMSDTPSGYPKPVDGKPYDSEAPTQLWQSPFRHLSQFPNRRAARRRERLEALLKGQEITSTGMLSATNLTHTAATQDVSPLPHVENPLPDPPAPESIPTGTYTSIRPVSGPRMAVFIAVGVAVGGLAALQLNRVLTPGHAETTASAVATAAVAPAAPVVIAPPTPVRVAPSVPTEYAFGVEACAPEEAKPAGVPPLQVDIVAARPTARQGKPASTTALNPDAAHAAASDAVPAFVTPEQASQASCSRYPTVHIPTQLHPRINPLMTSNQVFSDKALVKSGSQAPHP